MQGKDSLEAISFTNFPIKNSKQAISVIVDNSRSIAINDPNNKRWDIANNVIDYAQSKNIPINLISFGGRNVKTSLFVTKEKLDSSDLEDVIKKSFDNSDFQFEGIRVLKRTDSFPESPVDGKIVKEGFFNSIVDEGLKNGETAYYRIYTFDKNLTFSSGVCLEVPSQATESMSEFNDRPNRLDVIETRGGNKKNLISWNTNDNILNVKVFCSKSGYPTLTDNNLISICDYKDGQYIHRNVKNGEKYYYALVACNKQNGPANYTDTVPQDGDDDISLPEVKNVKCEHYTDKEVCISWDSPFSISPDIDGFFDDVFYLNGFVTGGNDEPIDLKNSTVSLSVLTSSNIDSEKLKDAISLSYTFQNGKLSGTLSLKLSEKIIIAEWIKLCVQIEYKPDNNNKAFYSSPIFITLKNPISVLTKNIQNRVLKLPQKEVIGAFIDSAPLTFSIETFLKDKSKKISYTHTLKCKDQNTIPIAKTGKENNIVYVYPSSIPEDMILEICASWNGFCSKKEIPINIISPLVFRVNRNDSVFSVDAWITDSPTCEAKEIPNGNVLWTFVKNKETKKISSPLTNGVSEITYDSEERTMVSVLVKSDRYFSEQSFVINEVYDSDTKVEEIIPHATSQHFPLVLVHSDNLKEKIELLKQEIPLSGSPLNDAVVSSLSFGPSIIVIISDGGNSFSSEKDIYKTLDSQEINLFLVKISDRDIDIKNSSTIFKLNEFTSTEVVEQIDRLINKITLSKTLLLPGKKFVRNVMADISGDVRWSVNGGKWTNKKEVDINMDINSVNVKFELSHNQKVNKVTVFCSQKELETVFHSGLKGTVIVKDKIIHLTQINERSASLEKITNCVYRIKNSSFNEKDRVTIFSKDGEFTDSEFAFYVDTGIVVLNDCSKTPTRVIISSENQILKV